MPPPPIAVPRLASSLAATAVAATRHSLDLRIRPASGPATTIRLQRCAAGHLRDSYPTGAYDIEIDAPTALSGEILAILVPAIQDAEPHCRRIVVAPSTDDDRAVAAALSAGFRLVTDVDLPDAHLALLVAEPHWVTVHDTDPATVPGT